MSSPLLSVRNLSTRFHTSDGIVRAVDDISLVVHAGETVGIVGESGSGKSVTARSIMRLIADSGRIVGGRIEYKHRDLLALTEAEMQRIRGAQISMIFQDPMTFLNPIMTVGSQVREVIRRHQRVRGRALQDSVVDALHLARVPTPERIVHFYPHQLSGGMRQRVLIAIAVACSPELLIADEPTTALDVTIQAQILQILKNIVRKRAMAMLLITHDLGVIAGMCDRVYVMYAGQIVEEADTLRLFEDPKHPYTQGLLRTVTAIPHKVERFPSIEGYVPNLLSPPPGCRFHPRCSYAMPVCRVDDPTVMLKHEERRDAACWLYHEIQA